MNVKLKPFHPYIRLAMYHTWLYDYVADRSIYDNEIIYIDKGKLSLFIDGKTYILKEGDVAIIPPNVYHKITWYEENCCQPHVHFDFDKDEFSSIIPVSMHRKEQLNEEYFRPNYWEQNKINMPYVIHCKTPSVIRNTLLDLINVYSLKSPTRELEMEGLLKYLIGLIVAESVGYYEDNEQKDTLSLLTTYMGENVQNNLSMEDFMMKANLSIWSLNEIFKKAYNTTPKKYYDSLRIRYAKNLITHSFKSVKEISALLSFNDPQTFSRWFKKMTGKYPTQYKK